MILLAVLCGFAVLLWVALLPLRIREARILRRTPTAELEARAFDFKLHYFSFIGLDHPDVLAFKHLVDTRDLVAIRAVWPRLEKSFRRLEHAAGHRGRPLIFDYYFGYEMLLTELTRRHTF